MRTATLYLGLVLFRSCTDALQVTAGSSCAALCLEDPEADALDPSSSSTNPGEVACNDDDYESTSTGIKYKNCIDCLQKSNATQGTEEDSSWLLYNLRYSVDVCMYGFQNESKRISSPCDIEYACQPLRGALEAGRLDPSRDQYEYCSVDGGIFSTSRVDSCIQCFSTSTEQVYIANFITALKAGCEQRPAAGDLFGLSGTLFSKTLVNITEPPVNGTILPGESSTAMSQGTIVGIAVGAGLLFLGGTALFWVYHKKQKKLYAEPFRSEYDPRSGNKSITPPLGGGFSTPDSKSMSLLSDYELRAQVSYANNSDVYDQLEKESMARRPHYTLDPNNPLSGQFGALPAHPAYVPRTHSRQTSLGESPERPKPVKTNKPDSYALQTYLNAAEDATAPLLPGPPPGPPPAAAALNSKPHRRSPLSLDSFGADASQPTRPSSLRRSTMSSSQPSVRSPQPPPPPPPPPRGMKVPSLVLPSVARMRVPKKYVPPKITIEGATPVERSESAGSGELPIGIEISAPVVNHEPRFVDDTLEMRRGRGERPQAAEHVVEQTATDRRQWVTHEVEIQTGKSSMYG
jgi:hypothetical protein